MMTSLLPISKNGKERNSGFGFGSLPALNTWLDDVFNDTLETNVMSNFNTGMTLPAVNVKETADNFIVDMAVPGLKKSDFDISLENELLTISAELEASKEEKNDENFTRREFGYSSFKRTFTLPDGVETDKIAANYTNGILHVVLPKREEVKKKPARTIKIS